MGNPLGIGEYVFAFFGGGPSLSRKSLRMVTKYRPMIEAERKKQGTMLLAT